MSYMRHVNEAFKTRNFGTAELYKGVFHRPRLLSEKSPLAIMKLSNLICSIALACTIMTVTVSGMITNRNTESLELNEDTNQEKVLNVKGLSFETKGKKKLPKGRGQRRAGFTKNREFKKEAKNKRSKYNAYSSEGDQSSLIVFNDTGDYYKSSN